MIETCQSCDSPNVVHVQYGRIQGNFDGAHVCHYDGVSEIECKACGARYGRWSGRKLGADEHEPPYGKTHHPDCGEITKREIN